MKVPDYQNQIPAENRPHKSPGSGQAAEAASVKGYKEAKARNPIEAPNDVDAVEVSSFSLELLADPQTAAKVEALQKLYEQGGYIVDPEQLAKSIVESHLSQPDFDPGKTSG